MKYYVYFLLNGSKIIYIGMSVSIKNRLTAHKRNGKIFDSVRVITVDNIKAARHYEARWIQ